MNILIDGHALSDSKKTGKHFYSLSLLNELVNNKKFNQFNFDVLAHKNIIGLNKKFNQIITHEKGFGYYWHLNRQSKNYDIVLSPTSYIPSLFIRNNLITIVYDLAVFQKEFRSNLKASLLEKLLLPKVMKNSSQIITISDSVNKKLKAKFKDVNITTIPAFSKLPTTKKSHPHKNYFLFVGTLEPRKNLINTLKGFELFLQNLTTKTPPKLILVGKKGWNYKNIFKFIQNENLQKHIQYLDYVSDKKLLTLYRESIALTYIPFYEGFGLPIIESISQGTSVITSRTSTTKEILGPCGIAVNPHKPKEISQAMERIYLDEKLRKSLERETTTWIKNFYPKSAANIFFGKILK